MRDGPNITNIAAMIGDHARAEVLKFHDTAVAQGGTSVEEPPGVREGSLGKMYLAYVRDPDGHKLCAIYRPK